MTEQTPSATPSLVPLVTGTTKIFGVIAHPSAHVRAPMVFNERFVSEKRDHLMIPIDATPDALVTVMDGLRAMENFGGLTITIPHKMPIAQMCDELGEAARVCGAVNAVRFGDDGRLYGDIFDGAGFVAGLALKGHEIVGKRVLMLGAGGAARAIAVALCQAGVGEIAIANRTREKAENLVNSMQQIAGYNQAFALDNMADAAEDVARDIDIIINSTSLGLHAGDALPLPLENVRPDTLIADIIMLPARTDWLAVAEDKGLQTHYGRHMLDCQLELIGRFIGALD
ncbi:shikimate dehydrogenase family protein [Candidatus Puniceispirillum sp.]|jgi:shikimate dehydrogenase|uniref:shikimate dehydrogenase family protein n=1 Tax=Candidatus Puniceispirillum sp. TaxID=2026719 RepID=UPI001EC44214|nr:shikimate dehydrogenase [Candidatus Puniceispirillum sp.]MBT6566903.1 shikimate dehydrogenase [Candidatus Puniceispirillum sp.]